jgi:hypothetical protein
MIHLVTLLEALPVQETADAVAELEAADLRIGTVIVNRASKGLLPADVRNRAATGDIDTDAIRAGLTEAGISLSDQDFQGFITETIEHSATLRAQDDSAAELTKVNVSRLYLPALEDGMDLGGLYELAEHLTAQGVR